MGSHGNEPLSAVDEATAGLFSALRDFSGKFHIVGALFVHPLYNKVLINLFKHRVLIRNTRDDVVPCRLGLEVKVFSVIVEMLVCQELLHRPLFKVKLLRD